MSLESKNTIQCCNCDHEQEVTVANSLNTGMDPEAYDKAIHWKEMIIKCDNCGKGGFYDHPLLYHDMDKHFMIQYTTSADVAKDFIETHQKMVDTYQGLTDHYIMRICDYYPSFVEKVMLFTHGYNDLVMEQYKLNLFFTIEDTDKIKDLFYQYHEEYHDCIRVQMKDGENRYYAFQPELYNKLKEKIETFPEYKFKDNYIVDTEYALNVNNGDNTPLHYKYLNMERKDQKKENKIKEEVE